MSEPALQLTRCIAADHPAFAGHFPGRPLLPGALLLAEVMEALRTSPPLSARIGERPTIAHAKFLAPIGPGDELGITVHDEAHGLRFEVRRGGVLAASGRLLPELAVQ
ncbi:3-hydroxyacyl-ACP dehydratase FabZ family protein [Methylibium sp.]|uniref:3-hydroxyacyl-ACP dehydratase FabZ family protein n=1 Tax=Methylibium sp. TaxID=2067992 RepID=UPI003D0D7506